MGKWVFKTAFLFFCVTTICCKLLYAQGWISDINGELGYVDINGNRVRNTFIKNADIGKWFYLDENGYIAKDIIKEVKGSLYYFDEYGVMARECWVPIIKKDVTNNIVKAGYYYFDTNGEAIKGTKNNMASYIIDGTVYYFDENGINISEQEINKKTQNVKKDNIQSKNHWEIDNDGEIYYIDAKGNRITNSFAVNIEINKWFYLDEDGRMVKNTMKEIDNNKYYFNEYGVMEKDRWVKINSDFVSDRQDPISEYYYYYIGPDGKAIKSGSSNKPRFYRLDGKTYLFNEYGQLLIGWINEDGVVIDEEENEHPYEEALYYSNSEGELVSGWVKTENSYREEEYVRDAKNLWFYFEPRTYKKNGYKRLVEKDIGDGHYTFSDKGYLYMDFSSYNLDNDRQEAFYGEDKGGKKYKAQWAWTVPPDDDTYTENEKSEKHWMYLEKSGKPVKNERRKINHKYYSFSENGIMQTGIVAYLNGTILFVADMELTSAEDIVKKGKFTYRKNGEIYYFYDGTFVEGERTIYFAGYDEVDESIRTIEFGTLDPEINTKRQFTNTGRASEFYDSSWSAYTFCDNIRYYYFGDDGAMVNGRKRVHFMDGEYYFYGGVSGHYSGIHRGRYYYDGIELAASKEIGYGIYTIEPSGAQTAQKLTYEYTFAPNSYYDPVTIPSEMVDVDNLTKPTYLKLNDEESLYKVLDPNGRIVKGRDNAYMDKQRRYWFISKNGNWLYGIFNTPVKRNKSKITFRTKLDKSTCPSVLLGNDVTAKINYLQEYDIAQEKYNVGVLFEKDFRDSYSFIKSGNITDVQVIEDKKDKNKLSVTISYSGMVYKAMYGNKYMFIPFGVCDENGLSASFFYYTNDFKIVPDDNDLFVNCCWEAVDACDFMCDRDSDGVRNMDYYESYR